MSSYPVLRGDLAGRQSFRCVNLADIAFVAGVMAMTLQSTQFGPFLPAHIWLLIVLPWLIAPSDKALTSNVERFVFISFVVYATAITLFYGVGRVKQYSQIIKFIIVYPGFYYAGLYYGARYANRGLPLGYAYLLTLLAFEIVVENAAPAMLYKPLDFGENALHGTFKERNWLADYFFVYSFVLFEIARPSSRRQLFLFFLLNLSVMILSGSKTAMIACVLVIAFRATSFRGLRLLVIALAATLYMWVFADQFSEELMGVRLEQERGLAFNEAVNLIAVNPLGHGFGFVEAYFQHFAYEIRGLGEGTNSVFSVPLDFLIIAGPLGLVAWLVFFVGLGTGSFPVLFPVAALSLLNPLHQSEFIYFFVGMLISLYASRRRVLRPSHDSSELPAWQGAEKVAREEWGSGGDGLIGLVDLRCDGGAERIDPDTSIRR